MAEEEEPIRGSALFGERGRPPLPSGTMAASFGGSSVLDRGGVDDTPFSASFSSRTPGAYQSPTVNNLAKEALKEIITSPSPKVSTLVEQIKVKQAKQEQEAIKEAEREEQRMVMLHEAEKVRMERKARAEDARLALTNAENAREESDKNLRAVRSKLERAKSHDGSFEIEERELKQAEAQYLERVKEARAAKLALETADNELEESMLIEQEVSNLSFEDSVSPQQLETLYEKVEGLQLATPPASQVTSPEDQTKLSESLRAKKAQWDEGLERERLRIEEEETARRKALEETLAAEMKAQEEAALARKRMEEEAAALQAQEAERQRQEAEEEAQRAEASRVKDLEVSLGSLIRKGLNQLKSGDPEGSEETLREAQILGAEGLRGPISEELKAWERQLASSKVKLRASGAISEGQEYLAEATKAIGKEHFDRARTLLQVADDAFRRAKEDHPQLPSDLALKAQQGFFEVKEKHNQLQHKETVTKEAEEVLGRAVQALKEKKVSEGRRFLAEARNMFQEVQGLGLRAEELGVLSSQFDEVEEGLERESERVRQLHLMEKADRLLNEATEAFTIRNDFETARSVLLEARGLYEKAGAGSTLEVEIEALLTKVNEAERLYEQRLEEEQKDREQKLNLKAGHEALEQALVALAEPGGLHSAKELVLSAKTYFNKAQHVAMDNEINRIMAAICEAEEKERRVRDRQAREEEAKTLNLRKAETKLQGARGALGAGEFGQARALGAEAKQAYLLAGQDFTQGYEELMAEIDQAEEAATRKLEEKANNKLTDEGDAKLKEAIQSWIRERDEAKAIGLFDEARANYRLARREDKEASLDQVYSKFQGEARELAQEAEAREKALQASRLKIQEASRLMDQAQTLKSTGDLEKAMDCLHRAQALHTEANADEGLVDRVKGLMESVKAAVELKEVKESKIEEATECLELAMKALEASDFEGARGLAAKAGEAFELGRSLSASAQSSDRRFSEGEKSVLNFLELIGLKEEEAVKQLVEREKAKHKAQKEKEALEEALSGADAAISFKDWESAEEAILQAKRLGGESVLEQVNLLEQKLQKEKTKEIKTQISESMVRAQKLLKNKEFREARKVIAQATAGCQELEDRDQMLESLHAFRRGIDRAEDEANPPDPELEVPEAAESEDPQPLSPEDPLTPQPPATRPSVEEPATQALPDTLDSSLAEISVRKSPAAVVMPQRAQDSPRRATFRDSETPEAKPTPPPHISDEDLVDAILRETLPNVDSNILHPKPSLEDSLLSRSEELEPVALGFRVSTMQDGLRAPDDNFQMRAEELEELDYEDLNLTATEDISGGLMVGANHELASLSQTAGARLGFSQLPDLLTPQDQARIQQITLRMPSLGTKNSELLRRCIQANHAPLVQAYREFQFHMEERVFVDSLTSILKSLRV